MVLVSYVHSHYSKYRANNGQYIGVKKNKPIKLKLLFTQESHKMWWPPSNPIWMIIQFVMI